MQITIQTQFRENYGAHDWDGKGECPQYWKCKGGEEYLIQGVPPNLNNDMVLAACDRADKLLSITHKSEYSEEYVISYSLEDDNYVPQYEQEQLEWYDGVIKYPVKRFWYSALGL